MLSFFERILIWCSLTPCSSVNSVSRRSPLIPLSRRQLFCESDFFSFRFNNARLKKFMVDIPQVTDGAASDDTRKSNSARTCSTLPPKKFRIMAQMRVIPKSLCHCKVLQMLGTAPPPIGRLEFCPVAVDFSGCHTTKNNQKRLQRRIHHANATPYRLSRTMAESTQGAFVT